MQVEVFIRVLLEQSWAPEVLHKWQLRLRVMARSLCLPCRLWFEAVHGLDLTEDPARVQAAVVNLQGVVQNNCRRNIKRLQKMNAKDYTRCTLRALPKASYKITARGCLQSPFA